MASLVQRVPCTTAGCDYVLTLPFERRCPGCFFKNKSAIPPQFEMLSADAILAMLPKAASPAAAADGSAASSSSSTTSTGSSSSSSSSQPSATDKTASKKPAKEKAPPKPQPPQPSAWHRVHIATAHIVSAERHPDSEKLLVCKVNVGEAEPRSICAGLQAYYTPEEFTGKDVCTVLNLSAKKLGGVVSAGMILASTNAETGTVAVLRPPEGSVPGDIVYLEGEEGPSKAITKKLASKVWDEARADLKVLGGAATWSGKALVCSKGAITAPGFPDGSPIS